MINGMKNVPDEEYTTNPGSDVSVHGVCGVNSSGQSFHP